MSPAKPIQASRYLARGFRLALASVALLSLGYSQDSKPAVGAPAASATTDAKPATARKTFIDYILPMPAPDGGLSKDAWGAAQVGARDQKNGLEDTAIKQFNYWDGQIIKGPDGKYHIFASRWDQGRGHGAWGSSVAIHAVSDNLLGPYIDKGMLWPDNQGGKGHNVTALVLPDGRYAVIVSETRPGDVFVSKSLDGPWEQIGSIKVDQPNWRASNYSVMLRPDGNFEIVPRSGQILISKDGILGPYKVMGPSINPKVVDGVQLRNLEDPVVWYSGGLYHIVVNNWSTRQAFHLVSKDGITDWRLDGLAYNPVKNFSRYSDGTVNHWAIMERPGVVVENGHVVALTLASIDVPKNQDKGNDGNGSKIVVMPVDGAALDAEMNKAFDALVPTAALVNAPAKNSSMTTPSAAAPVSVATVSSTAAPATASGSAK